MRFRPFHRHVWKPVTVQETTDWAGVDGRTLISFRCVAGHCLKFKQKSIRGLVAKAVARELGLDHFYPIGDLLGQAAVDEKVGNADD